MKTWILLVVRDRMELTKRTMDSLLQNTSPVSYGIMVVDVGSEKPTKDLLNAYFNAGKIERLSFNCPGTTPQWQKTYAIRQAFGQLNATENFEFMAWIDNDVEVKKDWLAISQKVLKEPGLGVSAVTLCTALDPTQRSHATVRKVKVGDLEVHLTQTANGALWVFRRDFFFRYGFPPLRSYTREGVEDWYYSDMMCKAGDLFAAVPGYAEHLGVSQSMRKQVAREEAEKEKLNGPAN